MDPGCNGDKFPMNYFILFFLVLFLIITKPRAANKEPISEFEKFCLIYMRYVNQYPNGLSAGCCEIDHPSNNKLKEEYLGEPMLYCNGQYIYE